jgi:sRNA-binding protein
MPLLWVRARPATAIQWLPSRLRHHDLHGMSDPDDTCPGAHPGTTPTDPAGVAVLDACAVPAPADAAADGDLATTGEDGEAGEAGEGAPVAAGAAPAVAPMSPAECGQRLAALFPALFAGPPRPLKLRIHVDIQARAPGVFSRAALSAFMHRHTLGNAYLRAVAQGGQRYDLDGQPAGELAAEHRQAAADELARRRERFLARRAAERGATPAAPRQAPTPPEAGDAAPGAAAATPPAAARPDARPPPRPHAVSADARRAARPEGGRPGGPQGGSQGGRAEDRRGPPGPGRPAPARDRPRGDARRDGPRDAFHTPRPDASAAREGHTRHAPAHEAAARAWPARQARRDPAPAEHLARPPRPPLPGPRPAAAAEPADPGQRERAQLLHEVERTTLSLANFCALKGLSLPAVEAQLELARRERAGRGGAAR